MNEKLELLAVVLAVIAVFLITIYGRSKSDDAKPTQCCRQEAKEEIILTKVKPQAVKKEPLKEVKQKPKRKYKPRAKKQPEVNI